MPLSNKKSSTRQPLLPASDAQARHEAKLLLVHANVVSWTFDRGTVVWTIWPAVLLHTSFAAAVTSVSLATKYYLAVPPVLITVLGVVIGFVISYRASSGYDRYWMGRCCWSDIIKTSRTMSRLIWLHAPLRIDKNTSSNDLTNASKCMREKRLALELVEGFSVAVKHHLRGEVGIYYEDLYHLVKPLHKHSPTRHRQDEPSNGHAEQQPCGTSTAISMPSPASVPRHEPSLSPDPVIPAINEYGTFGRTSGSLCSIEDESERPFLFPSTPQHPARPKVLTELIPFASFFSSLRSAFQRKKRKYSDFLIHSDEAAQEDDDDNSEGPDRKRKYSGLSRRKFRPAVAGGGRNVPLEILQCLSEWLDVLDERGIISGNALGGMYGCISAFEDSLTSLERILTTPIPLVYSAHIRQCVWIYLFLLPFQLLEQFGWYTIPGVCIAAFFYIGFLASGEEIEQPFGYDENDLDLDLFCREIIHADIESLKRTHNRNIYDPKTHGQRGKAVLQSSNSIAGMATT